MRRVARQALAGNDDRRVGIVSEIASAGLRRGKQRDEAEGGKGPAKEMLLIHADMLREPQPHASGKRGRPGAAAAISGGAA
jgi:hypothetical protein